MFVKILVFAVIGTLLAAVLKKHCRELVPFFEAALAVAAFIIIADNGAVDKSSIEKIFSAYSQTSEIFSAVFKGAAVTVITRITCDVCREGGNSLAADIVELGGRLMLIVLAMPFIEKVSQIALSFCV